VNLRSSAFPRPPPLAGARAAIICDKDVRWARRFLGHRRENRFGTLPEQRLPRIERSTDVEQLLAAALQVSTIAAPEELNW
jgi:hypothetical protein